jgi:hypothetical protein
MKKIAVLLIMLLSLVGFGSGPRIAGAILTHAWLCCLIPFLPRCHKARNV